MVNYVFDESASRQNAVIDSSRLDNEELELIASVATWDSPNKWTELIFEVAGRSVTFRSPTRKSSLEDMLDGKFDGLQLIGVGGNTFFIQEGGYFLPENIVIRPPDDRNHASQLRRIGEQKRINSRGVFKFDVSPYIPLHGLEVDEARNRKRFTEFIASFVREYREQGIRPVIVGPELAAEGYFPDKRDERRKPLQFQVYRVPTIKRIPSQFISTVRDSPHYTAGFEFLEKVSHLVGYSLRTLHSLDVAYLDGHAGNMSLIESNDKRVLYITDFGPMKNISRERYAARYRGLDLCSYLRSLPIIINTVFDVIPAPNHMIGTERVVERISQHLTTETLSTYFKPEISSGKISRDNIDNISRVLLHYAINKSVQSFAEEFERICPTEKFGIMYRR